MFQGNSSSPAASFNIFSILSAIRFYSMINLIRGVLRGENQAMGINRIKNMRFPEMHFYSILLISMASSSDIPPKFDSGKLNNPKCSFEISNIPLENGSGSTNHPLKKLGMSCKAGLGIILGSPFDHILFGQQVKGNFPKLLGSALIGAHHHEPFINSSPLNNSNNIDMITNNNNPNEWPCVFAQNQLRLYYKKGSQLTICTKHRNAGFLSLEDIENTDYYTRLINYLPYHKITHMYNYCILDFPQTRSSNNNFNNKNPFHPPRVHNLRRWSILSSNENFLKNCEKCDRPLEGSDVYIYRGESSFCSLECRYWKVKAERDFEKVTRMVPMASSSRNNKKPVFYLGAKPPASA